MLSAMTVGPPVGFAAGGVGAIEIQSTPESAAASLARKMKSARSGAAGTAVLSCWRFASISGPRRSRSWRRASVLEALFGVAGVLELAVGVGDAVGLRAREPEEPDQDHDERRRDDDDPPGALHGVSSPVSVSLSARSALAESVSAALASKLTMPRPPSSPAVAWETHRSANDGICATRWRK